MNKALTLLPALGLFLISSCTSVQIRERQRVSAPHVGCEPSEVYITEVSNWTWFAECHRRAFRCTIRGRTEVECTEEGATSGGTAETGTTPTEPEHPPTVAEEVAPVQADDVRVTLDGMRDAILACGPTPPVGISLTVGRDGATSARLTGANAGTSEEACVRQVLREVRVTDPAREGETIIHVIR